MHTDLSPHLHSDRCNELIQILKNCHAENAFTKFFGMCNSADNEVVKCLKGERLLRRDRNLQKAKENKERLRKLWEEERVKNEGSM